MNELSEEIHIYNGELDKDVLHLPVFSIYTRKRFSDIKKTKAMVVSKKPNSPKINNIAIDGQQIEQVTSYMYLGS